MAHKVYAGNCNKKGTEVLSPSTASKAVTTDVKGIYTEIRPWPWHFIIFGYKVPKPTTVTRKVWNLRRAINVWVVRLSLVLVRRKAACVVAETASLLIYRPTYLMNVVSISIVATANTIVSHAKKLEDTIVRGKAGKVYREIREITVSPVQPAASFNSNS